jgi:hypothetical protein
METELLMLLNSPEFDPANLDNLEQNKVFVSSLQTILKDQKNRLRLLESITRRKNIAERELQYKEEAILKKLRLIRKLQARIGDEAVKGERTTTKPGRRIKSVNHRTPHPADLQHHVARSKMDMVVDKKQINIRESEQERPKVRRSDSEPQLSKPSISNCAFAKQKKESFQANLSGFPLERIMSPSFAEAYSQIDNQPSLLKANTELSERSLISEEGGVSKTSSKRSPNDTKRSTLQETLSISLTGPISQEEQKEEEVFSQSESL